MKRLLLTGLVISATCIFAHVRSADTVRLYSGRTVQGVIAEQDDDSVKIRTRGGTVTLPRGEVLSIEKSPPDAGAASLPTWDAYMQPTATAAWADGLRQIPASVIDNGVLQYVPYLSYQAGDYELNIYGDPENPACIEIGIRNQSLKSDAARANCLTFMADVLKNQHVVATLKTLTLTKDTREVQGITLEVTPETDPDAYGGWWISAYSMSKLDASRATPAELAGITTKRVKIAATQPGVAMAPVVAAVPKNFIASATNPATPSTGTASGSGAQDSHAWTPDDLSRARKSTASGGGGVYVRSYTRRDGTYVQGHTRSAPSRGGGRR